MNQTLQAVLIRGRSYGSLTNAFLVSDDRTEEVVSHRSIRPFVL